MAFGDRYLTGACGAGPGASIARTLIGTIGREAAASIAQIVCGPDARMSRHVHPGNPLVCVHEWVAPHQLVALVHVMTPVFDAYQVLGTLDIAKSQRLDRWLHENRSEHPLWRSRVFDVQPEQAPVAATSAVFAASDAPPLGRILASQCAGELVMIASANFLRGPPRERHRLVCESPAVFASVVDAWDESLEDYVYGVVSMAPAVVLALFEHASEIAPACAELSANCHVVGNTVDMSIDELLQPLQRRTRLALVLNQGDKGYEDAVWGVYRVDDAAMRALSGALRPDVEITFGGQLHSHTLRRSDFSMPPG